MKGAITLIVWQGKLLYISKQTPVKMKIRCTANHLRFRLRKSDVEELSGHQSVRETISIAPGQRLAFELAAAPVDALQASYQEGVVRVSIPTATAQNWIDTDEVGIEGQYAFGKGETLSILIEKDFPCKHQPQEEKGDTFQELARKER